MRNEAFIITPRGYLTHFLSVSKPAKLLQALHAETEIPGVIFHDLIGLERQVALQEALELEPEFTPWQPILIRSISETANNLISIYDRPQKDALKYVDQSSMVIARKALNLSQKEILRDKNMILSVRNQILQLAPNVIWSNS